MCASRRPALGTGFPAEGDSRGCMRCAADGAGAVERGPVAASPGCALIETGATEAPVVGGVSACGVAMLTLAAAFFADMGRVAFCSISLSKFWRVSSRIVASCRTAAPESELKVAITLCGELVATLLPSVARLIARGN